MTPQLEKILKFIQKHPNATYKDICNFTGAARATVWNQTNQLLTAELIDVVPPQQETRFIAVKKK